MAPHPNMSRATSGVGRKRSPTTDGAGVSNPPAVVSPNRSRNRGPAGRNRRRRHREVQLQRVRQQEHAAGGRPPFELGEPHRVELIDQCARPVVEHIRDPNTLSDAEGEVDVGEAVAAAYGERAHDGSATTRSSSCASLSTRSRRASRCWAVNMRLRS
jgi:hypothetical protein